MSETVVAWMLAAPIYLGLLRYLLNLREGNKSLLRSERDKH